jgi:hypothetical protein
MDATNSCNKSCGCAAAPAPCLPQDGPMKGGGAALSSRFAIPGMDCPAEESLVRMALADVQGLTFLDFDFQRREMRVLHQGPVEPIVHRLETLGLGSRLVSSSPALPGAAGAAPAPDAAAQTRVLIWLLAINAAMFGVEFVAGWLAQSAGLIADSLDMFADGAVYGLALHAVGRSSGQTLRAARLSGWLQALLALAALAEVARRLLFGSAPEPPLMMGIATLALIANLACVALLARHRDGGVHMKASWIFSTNDLLANLGVIAAGGLVAWTGSNVPDLVIGTLIALLVFHGARRILRLSA